MQLKIKDIHKTMKVPDKKQFAYAITQRFIMAMNDIISKNDNVTSVAFSEKVKMTPSNLTRLRTSFGEHSVTLEALGRICDVYSVSPYWLFTGKGEMYSNAELVATYEAMDARADDIETALRGMEALLKTLKSASNKNSNKTQKKRTK